MTTIGKFALFLALGASALHARIDLLLVPPDRPIVATPGCEFVVHLNNPTDRPEFAQLPKTVEADYASDRGRGRVTLEVVGGARELHVPAMRRLEVKLRLVDVLKAESGFVSLRISTPPTNAIMFELAGPTVPPPIAAAAAPPRSREIDLATDVEGMRRHISGYDPIYFAVGARDRLNARFQFSFKYRVFERSIATEPWWKEVGRDLYAAYTQTSIWDLESFSKPFYDSSYKPTIFLLHELDRAPDSQWSFSFQSGAQHESNGKGGSAAKCRS